MARVRGIVVDSRYLVKGDVAERAEFKKATRAEGSYLGVAVSGHTPSTNRLY